MKEIPLTQGKVTLVDDEDYEWLNQWKWQAQGPHRHTWYAIRSIWFPNGKRAGIRMPRIILNLLPGMQCDHINGDGLDNRRANLRICTNQQNQWNQRKRENSTFKGVWKEPTRTQYKKPYGAQIIFDGKRKFLGRFATPEQAALAYNREAKKVFGEFAHLNKIRNA